MRRPTFDLAESARYLAFGIGASRNGVIFPVHQRPVQGTRGTYRVKLRHGVSRLRTGHRHTRGIVFHDAR